MGSLVHVTKAIEWYKSRTGTTPLPSHSLGYRFPVGLHTHLLRLPPICPRSISVQRTGISDPELALTQTSLPSSFAILIPTLPITSQGIYLLTLYCTSVFSHLQFTSPIFQHHSIPGNEGGRKGLLLVPSRPGLVGSASCSCPLLL